MTHLVCSRLAELLGGRLYLVRYATCCRQQSTRKLQGDSRKLSSFQSYQSYQRQVICCRQASTGESSKVIELYNRPCSTLEKMWLRGVVVLPTVIVPGWLYLNYNLLTYYEVPQWSAGVQAIAALLLYPACVLWLKGTVYRLRYDQANHRLLFTVHTMFGGPSELSFDPDLIASMDKDVKKDIRKQRQTDQVVRHDGTGSYTIRIKQKGKQSVSFSIWRILQRTLFTRSNYRLHGSAGKFSNMKVFSYLNLLNNVGK